MGIPRGSVDYGERLADAIWREIQEEYGVDIEVDELVDVADHILLEENQHWVSPSLLARVTAGGLVIKEPGKCSEIGWFGLDEIPADLARVRQLNLEHYRQRFRWSVSPVRKSKARIKFSLRPGASTGQRGFHRYAAFWAANSNCLGFCSGPFF
jgi:ADP-ribose pyrophosphatase YjhB (NUDIX family)